MRRMALFMVGAGVLVMANIVGFLELATSGVVEAVGAAARWAFGRPSEGSFVRGVLRLALAVLVAMTPFQAIDRAERANDWADEDGNGLLDPEGDGDFTWIDVNGDDFVRTWALAGALLTAAAIPLYRPSEWRWPRRRSRHLAAAPQPDGPDLPGPPPRHAPRRP